MKVSLQLAHDDCIELIITPDNDAEAIALKAWSDRYWRMSDGDIEAVRAVLLISTASPDPGRPPLKTTKGQHE